MVSNRSLLYLILSAHCRHVKVVSAITDVVRLGDRNVAPSSAASRTDSVPASVSGGAYTARYSQMHLAWFVGITEH